MASLGDPEEDASGNINQSGVGVECHWLCELWVARISLWVPTNGDTEAMPAPCVEHPSLHLTAPDQPAVFSCTHPVASLA